ncbi:helix-turn-helix domain protein [Clostridium sporogenes]|uniref:Helix-turn-helix domain protein n=1 Tax=Clostridium sporogenes TaxID=1509 RepID=A0A1L3NI72_CLOSG|nr:helix-turn-helix domain-containing protein [Clostridium sporogenes]APH15798.1 helix-turn-helix domain protein [Clostridium sporogenes]
MPGFTIVDNENILDNNDLSIQEQSVLIALISYYNKEKGYAYPSYKQLKLRSKLKDDRTLIKAINSLIRKDYLSKEILKGIGSKYFINKCNITPTGELQVQENCSTSNNTGTPTGKLQGDILENYSTTNTNTNTKTNTKYYIDLKFIDDVVDRVKITQEQYDKLVKKFNEDIVHNNIISLDNYIANGKGKKYKDHYRVLNTWCNKSKSKDEVKPGLDRKNLEDWRL